MKVSPGIQSSDVATSVETEFSSGAEVKENELSRGTFSSRGSLAQTDRPMGITQTGEQTSVSRCLEPSAKSPASGEAHFHRSAICAASSLAVATAS